jgi:hypothetical protein
MFLRDRGGGAVVHCGVVLTEREGRMWQSAWEGRGAGGEIMRAQWRGASCAPLEATATTGQMHGCHWAVEVGGSAVVGARHRGPMAEDRVYQMLLP